MKKFFSLIILCLLSIACSKEEEVQKFAITLDSSDGGSLNIPSGTYVHDRMTIITFFAIPDEGYAFTGWTGAGDSESQINLVVIEDRNIVANFERIQFTLRSTSEGQGEVYESLISDPHPNSTPGNVFVLGQNKYGSGSVVRLEADPATGWFFSGWTGDYVGTDKKIEIKITQDNTITAVFEPILQ